MTNKKLCIVCSSKLPQPPVKGGAVSTLIQLWVDENEINHKYDITCISVFDEEALDESKHFKHSNCAFVKISKFASFLDKITTWFLNLIKKTNKIYSWGYLFRTLSFRRGVKKNLKKNNYDVVVFENSIPVFLCMKSKRLQKKYNGKFFYHTHCVPRDILDSGKVLEKAKSVICVSEYIKEQTLKRFERYKLNCSVLYNCVDTEIFKPLDESKVQDWREQHNIKKDDFVVGFIGRLNKDKGIAELIEAVKRSEDRSVKLLIVGSTFYGGNVKDNYWKALAESSLEIKDRIIFTGYIKNIDTPLFYCSSDVVCLPAVWEEPGAVTNIEAAATGRPIISTFSGGNKEYIGDGKSMMLQKENKEELINHIAKSILDFKNNKGKRLEYAKKAYEWGKLQTRSKFYIDFLDTIE